MMSNRIVKLCLVLWLAVCFFLCNIRVLVGKDLETDLKDLEAMRKAGGETDLAMVDRRGAELLKAYPEPKEQGRIYYELAHSHAQSGLKHPERVIEYAQKALDYPQDPTPKKRLHVCWGDALQIANRRESLPVMRRLAAVRYLEGLNALSAYNLPDNAPDLPSVQPRGTILPQSGPIWEAAKLRHEQQMAARNKAEFEREMIMHRDVLTGQIADLYSRKPYANEEIAELAAGP